MVDLVAPSSSSFLFHMDDEIKQIEEPKVVPKVAVDKRFHLTTDMPGRHNELSNRKVRLSSHHFEKTPRVRIQNL